MTNNLIAKLEAAEGPSRELDGLIHGAIGRVERGFNIHKLNPNLPAYTASLDDAVSLVPEGWRVHEFQEADDGRWRCLVVRAEGRGGSSGAGLYWRPTPDLALCIAALKAREAGDG